MSKVSGLGSVVAVDDSGGTPRTISNDITNYSFAMPRGVQDITGVDKSAKEELLLLADFSITMNGVFNASTANQAHDVFKTIPSTSVVRTVTLSPNGTTSGLPKLPNECILSDYQITRANDGSLVWQVPGQLADGTVPTWTTN
jgi:hypothetical protein